ncbi:MAG: hypothetical protein ACREXX_08450 [Gammaproteobacteria bacterium]
MPKHWSLSPLTLPHALMRVGARMLGRPQDPVRYARRLALAKAGPAQSGLPRRWPRCSGPTRGGTRRRDPGQTAGADEVLAMLACLSGRCHEVYTAVALWLPSAYAPMGPVSSLSGPSRSPNSAPT